MFSSQKNLIKIVTVDQHSQDFSKFDNLQIPKTSGPLAEYEGRFVYSVACGADVQRWDDKTTVVIDDGKPALLSNVANCQDKITLLITQWYKDATIESMDIVPRVAYTGNMGRTTFVDYKEGFTWQAKNCHGGEHGDKSDGHKDGVSDCQPGGGATISDPESGQGAGTYLIKRDASGNFQQPHLYNPDVCKIDGKIINIWDGSHGDVMCGKKPCPAPVEEKFEKYFGYLARCEEFFGI